ncbi:MAG TPA: DNA repair protein RecO [Firmicutes bacterium]|nr:DNA repair protein RecO [Bacillota bacterium]
MKELRSHALVLRTMPLGEADKLLTLLTREAGKVKAVARGSRKTKSKFSALTEPLTLGSYLLHAGKTFYTFIQGELLKSYTGLQYDLERLAYAQYFCEICDRCLPEGEPSETVFHLLLTALEALEADPRPARVARCFELNLLEELGLKPALDACRVCGNTAGPFRFDPHAGSLVCTACPRPADSLPVNAASLAVMRRLLAYGFQKLSVCLLSPQSQAEIHQVCLGLLNHIFDVKRLQSLQFLMANKLL